uniref:Uncharacterized protein n=1 Tax=Oryza glumipatula TaxID=40148 RepID=A0A0E0AZ38_9ORYZ
MGAPVGSTAPPPPSITSNTAINSRRSCTTTPRPPKPSHKSRRSSERETTLTANRVHIENRRPARRLTLYDPPLVLVSPPLSSPLCYSGLSFSWKPSPKQNRRREQHPRHSSPLPATSHLSIPIAVDPHATAVAELPIPITNLPPIPTASMGTASATTSYHRCLDRATSVPSPSLPPLLCTTASSPSPPSNSLSPLAAASTLLRCHCASCCARPRLYQTNQHLQTSNKPVPPPVLPHPRIVHRY